MDVTKIWQFQYKIQMTNKFQHQKSNMQTRQFGYFDGVIIRVVAFQHDRKRSCWRKKNHQ